MALTPNEVLHFQTAGSGLADAWIATQLPSEGINYGNPDTLTAVNKAGTLTYQWQVYKCLQNETAYVTDLYYSPNGGAIVIYSGGLYGFNGTTLDLYGTVEFTNGKVNYDGAGEVPYGNPLSAFDPPV